MSFQKNYSENTLKKALHWLDEQDHGWSQHIKDSNVAVQMYLKSHKKEEPEENPFQKEMKSFLSEDIGAVSTDFKQSPPAKDFNKLSLKSAEPFLETNSFKNNSFSLDEKSLQSLELVKKELNIKSNEEALRLLIQLGQKSLNRL